MMRKLLRWNHVPAILLMMILFYLSSRSGQVNGWLQPPFDKLAHLIAYGALGFSFCIWIRAQRWEANKFTHGAIVVLAVSLFGISDEFHQSFVPGRDVSLVDWAADLTGGVLAVILFLAIRGYRYTDCLCRRN